MDLQLTTTAFENEGGVPSRFTCDGADVSPPLSWNDPPEGTRSLALIVDDPDAPRGTWVHWILFDLPQDLRELVEGISRSGDLPAGGRQGRNDFGRSGYGGPCPPPGPAHRYFFRLYALDGRLGLPEGASRADVDRAMRGHVLAHAELMGRYARRR